MVLSKDGSKRSCVVERPSGQSYLFFEQFKLEVTGAKLKETHLERQQGVPLRNEEYIVVSDGNYVQQWDNKFNSQLTKVQIIATSDGSSSDTEL